jgi:hypothetical protein
MSCRVQMDWMIPEMLKKRVSYARFLASLGSLSSNVKSRRVNELYFTSRFFTKLFVLCVSVSKHQGDNISGILAKPQKLILGQQTTSLHCSQLKQCG